MARNTTHISHTGITGGERKNSWSNVARVVLPVRGIVFVGKKKKKKRTNAARGEEGGEGIRNGARSLLKPSSERSTANFRPCGETKAGERKRYIYGETDAQTRHAHEFGRAYGPRERKGEGELLTFHDTVHARVTDSIQHDAFTSKVAAVLRASRYSAPDSCAV